MNNTTKIITSEKNIPAGFVRLCELTQEKSLQRLLSYAHGQGLIPAVKIMRTTKSLCGAVYLEKKVAEEFLDRFRQKSQVAVRDKKSDPVTVEPEQSVESVKNGGARNVATSSASASADEHCWVELDEIRAAACEIADHVIDGREEINKILADIRASLIEQTELLRKISKAWE